MVIDRFWLAISIVATMVAVTLFVGLLGGQRLDEYQQRCEALGGVVVKAYGGGHTCIKTERLHP